MGALLISQDVAHLSASIYASNNLHNVDHMDTMSYLDRTIALVEAQIALLTAASRAIAHLPGPVADVGLGNGRTYDHLRELLPDRRIFAFDKALKAATASVPPADDLILGDIRETIPYVLSRMGEPAVLIHCDIATGDPTSNLARSDWLPDLLSTIAADDALVLSTLPLQSDRFSEVDQADLNIAVRTNHIGLLRIYKHHPQL